MIRFNGVRGALNVLDVARTSRVSDLVRGHQLFEVRDGQTRQEQSMAIQRERDLFTRVLAALTHNPRYDPRDRNVRDFRALLEDRVTRLWHAQVALSKIEGPLRVGDGYFDSRDHRSLVERYNFTAWGVLLDLDR